MTNGPGEREPEYSSDIVGDVDVLARGRAPFDPPAALEGDSAAAAAADEPTETPAAAGGGGGGGRLGVRVTVRVPVGEAARWREQATAAGVSVSDWLRARAAADESPPVVTGRPTPRKRPQGRSRFVPADPAVVEQLSRIGNNVNQLARWANTERRPVDVAALWAVHRQLTQLREAVTAAPACNEQAGQVAAEVVVDLADAHVDEADRVGVVES